MDKQQIPPPDRKISGLLLIGVGTMFASMVISGLFLGYWVDVWLETAPLFMLIFALLGLIGGTLRAYRLLV